MGLAQVMDMPEELPSAEAKQRIESAEASDLAFIIRRAAKTPLAEDDVRMLAEILQNALRSSTVPLTKSAVQQALLDKGRSHDKAAELVDAIFK